MQSQTTGDTSWHGQKTKVIELQASREFKCTFLNIISSSLTYPPSFENPVHTILFIKGGSLSHELYMKTYVRSDKQAYTSLQWSTLKNIIHSSVCGQK